MHNVFILLVSFTDRFFHQGVELVSIEKWPFSAISRPACALPADRSVYIICMAREAYDG